MHSEKVVHYSIPLLGIYPLLLCVKEKNGLHAPYNRNVIGYFAKTTASLTVDSRSYMIQECAIY